MKLISLKEKKRGLPTFIFISNQEFLKDLSRVDQEFNFYHLKCDLSDPTQVLANADRGIELFKQEKIKSISLVGLGDGGALAQAIAVRTWRILRRLILVDAVTRLNLTLFERLMNQVESFLPLGLPLRKHSNAYDSRPELHRVQCPTLIFRSEVVDSSLDAQAVLLNSLIPNSWNKKLEKESDLIQEILDFEKVPAKRSQK